MDSYIKSAFEAVCKGAKPAETWYVCLMVNSPFYGGPEEGGWFGSDTELVSYQKCQSEEEAEALASKVKELAKELSDEARKEFGEHCLRQMEWLDARGLEADFLPEPDGEESYYVEVSQGIPANRYGERHYS